MHLLTVLVSLLLISAISPLPRLRCQVANHNERVSLSGEWQFALAASPQEAERLSAFFVPGAPPRSFSPIAVPGNWSMLGFEEPTYSQLPDRWSSEGFYIKHFKTPESMHKQRVLLQFGGVWDSAEVWLNGMALGRHDSGFTSFAFDVSKILSRDGDNVLAVQVRQRNHDYLLDVNDDWSLPGIYRDVSLEGMPANRWLDRVDLQTTFDDQFRDADLKVQILTGEDRPRSATAAPYELVLSLLDNEQRQAATQRITIPPHTGTDRLTNVTMHVNSPLHWTAETPNLYTLRVDLVEGGVVTHTRFRTVGFRQVTTAGGVFRVNGQAVKLRGVNRHDETSDHGRATTAADWERDLGLMKAANINFVRTSHYPPAEGFLELCDRIGMYVEDEVPLGFGGDNANDPSFLGGVMLRTSETVLRDLNHPSVLLWSVGNEDPLTAVHMTAIRAVKALDPTRPVLMPWRADESLPPEIDILAPHYYTAKKFDELASHSARPIIATEYSHAYGTQGFGGLEDRWKALTQHPAGAGGAIWMWADQGVQPKGSSLRLTVDGSDGIVSHDRESQRDYWETKAVYAPIYPTIERRTFTASTNVVTVPIRNDFDFTDMSEAEIGWRLMADGRELDSGSANLHAVAHSTADLPIPISRLKPVQKECAYYVLITATKDGKEIGMRSVELVPEDFLPQSLPTASLPYGRITSSNKQGLTVTAGSLRYQFDPATGRLTSASDTGAPFLSGLDLTLWRPLNLNDTLILTKGASGPFPDLNHGAVKLLRWKVKDSPSEVVIDAAVTYTVNSANTIFAEFNYTVTTDGALTVRYIVTPHVHQRFLPFIGLDLRLAIAPTRVRWLGGGPLDSFPNEKAAAPFGVWSLDTSGISDESIKSTRWAELSNCAGSIVRIEGSPYMRITPRGVSALAHVAGRGSKANPPEELDQRLSTDDSASFSGTLRITHKTVASARTEHTLREGSKTGNQEISIPGSH